MLAVNGDRKIKERRAKGTKRKKTKPGVAFSSASTRQHWQHHQQQQQICVGVGSKSWSLFIQLLPNKYASYAQGRVHEKVRRTLRAIGTYSVFFFRFFE